MAKMAAPIRFKARLLRPAEPVDAAWSFLVLPKSASARLPTRSMISVQGTLAGVAFTATLEPDGEGSHWLKVPGALREAAGVGPGAPVELAITPVANEPEPDIPPDVVDALAANAAADATSAIAA